MFIKSGQMIDWRQVAEVLAPAGLQRYKSSSGQNLREPIPMVGADFYDVLAPCLLGSPPEEAEDAYGQIMAGLHHNLNAIRVEIAREPFHPKRKEREAMLESFKQRSRVAQEPGSIQAIIQETEIYLAQIQRLPASGGQAEGAGPPEKFQM